MINKPNKNTIVAILFILGVIALAIYKYSNRVRPLNVNEGQQYLLDSMNILYGEARQVIKLNTEIIYNLDSITKINKVLIEKQTKEITKLQQKIRTLKTQNENILNETIQHINTDSTYTDSLRNVYFNR